MRSTHRERIAYVQPTKICTHTAPACPLRILTGKCNVDIFLMSGSQYVFHHSLRNAAQDDLLSKTEYMFPSLVHLCVYIIRYIHTLPFCTPDDFRLVRHLRWKCPSTFRLQIYNKYLIQPKEIGKKVQSSRFKV